MSKAKSLVFVGLSVGLSLVALGHGRAAWAHPTTAPLWGPSGLGVMPTTGTVPTGNVEATLGYERVEPTGGHVRYFPTVTGSYGFRRGEIGAVYTRERFSALGISVTNNLWAVHGKYRLFEHRSGAALAAGVHYLDLGTADSHATNLYVAGSLPVWRSEGGMVLTGHLGALQNRLRLAGASARATRAMVGVELRLRQNWSFAADYIPSDGPAARLTSLVARYETPSGWGGQIGVGKIAGDTKFFANVLYRFGGHR